MPNQIEIIEKQTDRIIVFLKFWPNNWELTTGIIIKVESSKTPTEVIPKPMTIAHKVINK